MSSTRTRTLHASVRCLVRIPFEHVGCGVMPCPSLAEAVPHPPSDVSWDRVHNSVVTSPSLKGLTCRERICFGRVPGRLGQGWQGGEVNEGWWYLQRGCNCLSFSAFQIA